MSTSVAPWMHAVAPLTRTLPSAWALLVVCAPLLAVTLAAKFAFGFGGTQLLLAVPLIPLAAGLGLWSGVLYASTSRTVACLLGLSLLFGLQLLQPGGFSLGTLALVAVVLLPYVLVVTPGRVSAEQVGRRFLDLSVVLALLGVLQFGLQFLIGATWAFPLEHFLPPSLIAQNYNWLNPLQYGSSIYKANGVFLLEPSMFSQLLALAITLELALYRRFWRLATYALALVVSYSGTGLMILAVTLPILAVAYRRYEILLLGLAMVGLALLFHEPLNLDLYLKRAQSFSDPNSSAFARFVGGTFLFSDYQSADPFRALVGFGAGSLGTIGESAPYAVAGMGWIKMLFEFGVIGSLAFWGVVWGGIWTSAVPVVVRVGLIVTTLTNGILDPWVHGLILTLAIWPGQDRDVAADAARTAAPPVGFGATA